MTKRHGHPWWLHLPAGALLLGFLVYVVTRLGEWPERVPFRFGAHGMEWGPAWGAAALVGGLSILFIALSATLDELWARQEQTKRFNPLTLLDELVVGVLVGAQAPLIEATIRGVEAIRFPWAIALLCAGGSVLAAALLERVRPFVATRFAVLEQQPEAFGRHLEVRLGRGERVVYWDTQNPRYVTLLSLGVPVTLWVGAGFSYGSEPWATAILAGIGLLLLSFYGGQRTRVTPDEIAIRYGLGGIRVFGCATSEITSIGVRRFAALREFGGYGIRFSGSTVGYFLAGSYGVEIGRLGKRSVLIGSDHPGRLAAVLAAVSGVEPTDLDSERMNR